LKGGISYAQTQTSWPSFTQTVLSNFSRRYQIVMKCVNLRTLPNKAATGVTDAYIQASCGKCYACLANRRRGWLFRLQNENLSSLLSIFCTFTYNEDNCPDSLDKCHLQRYFKRLRHYEDFTYYAIGEYGTHTYRPHYHAVIFFKSMSTEFTALDYYSLVSDLWQYGFVAVASVTYRRLNYVLHYHTRPKIVNGKKTFQLMSKGLGIDFLDDNMIDYMVQTKATTINDYNGNKYVIPRYYRKKLVDLGYQIDAPHDYQDKQKTIIENAFHKPLYQLSADQQRQFIVDRIEVDKRKLKNYNNQDKLI